MSPFRPSTAPAATRTTVRNRVIGFIVDISRLVLDPRSDFRIEDRPGLAL
jgi:hypothetical protein